MASFLLHTTIGLHIPSEERLNFYHYHAILLFHLSFKFSIFAISKALGKLGNIVVEILFPVNVLSSFVVFPSVGKLGNIL